MVHERTDPTIYTRWSQAEFQKLTEAVQILGTDRPYLLSKYVGTKSTSNVDKKLKRFLVTNVQKEKLTEVDKKLS